MRVLPLPGTLRTDLTLDDDDDESQSQGPSQEPSQAQCEANGSDSDGDLPDATITPNKTRRHFSGNPELSKRKGEQQWNEQKKVTRSTPVHSFPDLVEMYVGPVKITGFEHKISVSRDCGC